VLRSGPSLAGLAIQLLLFPDSFDQQAPEPVAPQGPQLPKVSITSKPSEVRQAFDSVSRVSQQQRQQLQQQVAAAAAPPEKEGE
jgi:hypothetical protein